MWKKSQPKACAPNDWQRKRAETVLVLARQLSLHQPHILDLGCGTGFASRMLDVLGPTEGIDLSPAAIAIARAENPAMTFRAGDVLDMDLGQSVYDLIVCQEVIRHVADQRELVNRMADALRPLGHLIITAANKFVQSGLQCGDGWLSRSELKATLQPRFDTLNSTSILPLGQHRVLRVINSYKLNQALTHLMSPEHLETLMGRLGWGYTMIVLTRKRSAPSN